VRGDLSPLVNENVCVEWCVEYRRATRQFLILSCGGVCESFSSMRSRFFPYYALKGMMSYRTKKWMDLLEESLRRYRWFVSPPPCLEEVQRTRSEEEGSPNNHSLVLTIHATVLIEERETTTNNAVCGLVPSKLGSRPSPSPSSISFSLSYSKHSQCRRRLWKKNGRPNKRLVWPEN
jgi:hypothetical protein